MTAILVLKALHQFKEYMKGFFDPETPNLDPNHAPFNKTPLSSSIQVSPIETLRVWQYAGEVNVRRLFNGM